MSNNDLAVRTSVEADITGFEMKPRTLKEAMDFCDLMANSDLVPNSYKGKPGNIMVAIQMGAELGMTPMRALRSIAVINGRATTWGDDMLAMVLNSTVCEYVNESDSSDKQGVCKTKRKGCAEQVSIFTLEDAKRAGLLGKQGPWQTNTSRMLKLRARGFGLRDTFADVLAGLVSTEEALDLPQIEPDDPKTNILEASQPLSLKDKLKAKVEQTETTPPPSSVHEPTVDEALADIEKQGEPPEELFRMASAVADYEIVIGDSTDRQELENLWGTIVKDPRITSEYRANLYKHYISKRKWLEGPKGKKA